MPPASDTAVDAPRWLTEGVADFVARPAAPRPGPEQAAGVGATAHRCRPRHRGNSPHACLRPGLVVHPLRRRPLRDRDVAAPVRTGLRATPPRHRDGRLRDPRRRPRRSVGRLAALARGIGRNGIPTRRILGRPSPPVRRDPGGEVGTQRLGHRRLDAGMARPAGPHVQEPQDRCAVPIGHKAGEPPGPVVCERAGRSHGVQVGVGRQPRDLGCQAGARQRRRRPVPRSRRRLRSATGVRPPPYQRGRRSERAHGATQFATRHRSSQRPPARRRCAGRWSRRRCRSRRPPSARNCSSDAVATMTMSRGQSAPQNFVTARTASSIAPDMRSSNGCVSGHPGSSAPPCGHPMLSRCAKPPRSRRASTGAGTGGRRGRPADKHHRDDQLDDQQQAQKPTLSTGGRCRSGHCSPGPPAPACRRWTRAPSFRRRCRSPNATRRSSS